MKVADDLNEGDRNYNNNLFFNTALCEKTIKGTTAL